MRWIVLFYALLFAACAGDSPPSSGLSNQGDASLTPDLQARDGQGAEGGDTLQADTCWWCEDAGPMDTNDPGLQDGVDPACYEACIAKGQEGQFCADYCGKKADGKDDGKDDAGNLTEEECYEGCVAKGESEELCAEYCAEAFGDGKGGGDAMDEACFAACMEKGQDEQFCADYCQGAPDKGDDGKDGEDDDDPANVDQACYDACIEKGQPEDVCLAACAEGADGK